MIKVYWANANHLLRDIDFETHLANLPTIIQAKIISYADKNDRAARVLSKLILHHMIRESAPGCQVPPDQLQYTSEGKPYLPGAPFHFSSTHSYPLVLCAMQPDGLVGIDTEPLRPVPIDDLTDYFTADEQAIISASADANHELLKLWSRKEAVLKAAGQGIFQPLDEIEVIENEITFNGRAYFLHTIDLDPGYVVHVATSEKDQEIQVTGFRV